MSQPEITFRHGSCSASVFQNVQTLSGCFGMFQNSPLYLDKKRDSEYNNSACSRLVQQRHIRKPLEKKSAYEPR